MLTNASTSWMEEKTFFAPMLAITIEDFEELVRQAVDTLPRKYRRHLAPTAVVVEEEPSDEVLAQMGLVSDDELLGLYTGTPERSESFFDSSGALPARILIYRGPILRLCRTREEVVQEVRDTVAHELGHHVGLEDDDMPY